MMIRQRQIYNSNEPGIPYNVCYDWNRNTAEIILRINETGHITGYVQHPVKPREYVLSNAVTNIVIVLVQICASIVMMRWVFKINTYVADWQMVVVLGCFGLVAIGLGMVIVAFARSSYEAGAAST